MATNRLRRNKSLDWVAFSTFFCLLLVGWLMLYAAVFDKESGYYMFMDFDTSIGKQTVWVGISLVAFVVTYSFDWKIWNTFSFPAYAISIALLLLVLIFGREINGAKSWFSLGGISFQPSEIAKFTTALALSSYLSSYKVDIRKRNIFLTALGILGLPIVLVLLQPDAGSAVIFLSFFILFLRKGLSIFYYIIGFSMAAIFILSLIYNPLLVSILAGTIALAILVYNFGQTWKSILVYVFLAGTSLLLYLRGLELYGAGILALSIAIYSYLLFSERMVRPIILVVPTLLMAILFSFGSSLAFEYGLKPHQKDRINVWLKPENCDPLGPLYNVVQSKLAIGSGGLKGKGFLAGDMTNLNYVPFQTTDFIFSTVGEEQGFIGNLSVIFLFTLLMIRCIIIGERAKNEFIRNYAYSVAGIIFIHFFFNVGMSMGLMPVVGIPLPFLSKGGSALLVFTVMIAALIKMDQARFRGA